MSPGLFMLKRLNYELGAWQKGSNKKNTIELHYKNSWIHGF